MSSSADTIRRTLPVLSPVLFFLFLLLSFAVPVPVSGQEVRARELGVPFQGRPGPLNAITDVEGVGVGHTTLIRGHGRLVVGEGPVRTGVTAVVPRLSRPKTPVFAGWFTLNGNGEMTGTTWVEESGVLEGPVMITNTLSVGVVHHAVIGWGVTRALEAGEALGPWVAGLPVVAETWDGSLNDIYGQHVREEHAVQAIEAAASGPVEEGNVGGGTGMICHRFKGGIGTASRIVEMGGSRHVVGVLVQCNYGDRESLRIAGAPVGREIPDLLPAGDVSAETADPGGRAGSIIVVVATDAPLLPGQLERMARKVSLGLGRMGSVSANSSGDIFVAFSTANAEGARGVEGARLETTPNRALTPLFRATVQATEEAIVNALVAAETMTGADSLTVHALPHDRLRRILERYGR